VTSVLSLAFSPIVGYSTNFVEGKSLKGEPFNTQKYLFGILCSKALAFRLIWEIMSSPE
jgi:hypothetical protein